MDWLTSMFRWLFGYKDQSKLVAQVQSTTVKLCGFLPYADTVLRLLAVNPAVATALTISTKICQAVTAAQTQAVGLMSAPPVVDGVEIEGVFIDREGK